MIPGLSQAAIDVRQVALGGLYEFVQRAWHQIDPAPFKGNWHIEVMCEHLERLYRGEIKDLAIMIPPGSSKSLVCQVLWPAWCWIDDPSEKFIFSTFETNLCKKFAKQMRDLVMNDWFQERWPHCYIPYQNTRSAGRFVTSQQGMRFSTGIGGAVTGTHGGILACDDPNKAQAAMGNAAATMTELLLARDYWNKVLPTRQVNPATTRRLLLQQCLHYEDVINHWIRTDPSVTVLCLPMEYDPAHPFVFPDDPRTEPGELLWPEHIPKEKVEKLKRSLGPLDYSAQYQQLPGRIGSEIIRMDWLSNYFRSIVTRNITDGVISCDLTFGSKRDSASYVAIGVWAAIGPQVYRVDQVRGRFSYTETKTALRAIWRKHRHWCPTIMIENKANGPAILDDLSSEIPGMIPGEPGSSNKLARILAVSGYLEAGDVLLPHPDGARMDGEPLDVSWVPDYQLELHRFSGGPADIADQVDETSQALKRLYQGRNTLFEAAMNQVAADLGV